MKIGTLALRVTIGGFFVGHGSQKLVGAQGGPGLKATGKHFEEVFGIKPGLAQATVAAVSETAGGLGLLLGYHTPLAASTVVGSMTTAIQKVHGKNGWNIQNGGFEYNAVLIAAAFAIAEQGPGFLSLDALRGKQRKGLGWGLFALGAGVGGAYASHAASGYFGGGSPLEAGADPASAVDSLVDSAKDVAGSAADAARDAVNSAADSAKDAVDAAADSAKDVADSVADSAKDAADSAKDAADSAADSAKDVADSAADSAKDAADSAKDAADSAKDAVSSAADSAKDAVSSAADSAKDAADSAKDAADSAS